jgi:hypothetical protein
MGPWPIIIKSNGPLGRVMGAPRPENDFASENKEQGKFQSHWASLYTWLTYDKDKNKMYCSKWISIGANNTMTAGCDNFKPSSLTIGMQLVQITRFIAYFWLIFFRSCLLGRHFVVIRQFSL